MTKAQKLLEDLNEAVDNSLIEYMALVLLCDAFASETENARDGSEDYDEEIVQKIHSESTAPRQDILKTIPTFWKELKIDFKKYLPLEFVKKFVSLWEKEWGKENVDSYLEEFGEDGAFKAIMNGVGHGVSPFDDTDSADFLKKKGITKLKTYVGDDYMSNGFDIFDAAYNKMVEKED